MRTDPEDLAHPHFTANGKEVMGGLSKREYFAAMAMQGLLEGNDGMVADPCVVGATSIVALMHADALISALNMDESPSDIYRDEISGN